jgi:hypothetical protein
MSKIPISHRLSPGMPWIQDDFPRTARVAVRHLLHDLVDRRYVRSWIAIDKEIRRIARDEPQTYDEGSAIDIDAARLSIGTRLDELKWSAVLDFCERVHSHLAVDVIDWGGIEGEARVIVVEREKVQLYIADELERIFLEERLAFTFVDNEIRARGRKHTRAQLAKVEATFADPRLSEARQHFAKATRYFQNKNDPDFENVIKEAICAVEAAAKRLFPDSKAKTLADVIKDLCSGNQRRLPKQIGDTIFGLYAYRGGGNGIAHGATGGGAANRALAEYVLAIAASQVILLHDIESEGTTELPF